MGKKSSNSNNNNNNNHNNNNDNDTTFTPTHLPTYNILILKFTSKSSMANALYRPQLYYEDSNIRNVYKSLEEMKKLPKRRFDGYNIPVETILEWFNNSNTTTQTDTNNYYGKPIITPYSSEYHNEEIDVINFIQSKYHQYSNAYLLAFLEGDTNSCQHELLHAYYHHDVVYRDLVNKHWNRLSDSLRKAIHVVLDGKAYHRDLHVDEFQAFLVESGPAVFGKKLSCAELVNAWKELSEMAKSSNLLKAFSLK